MSGCRRGIWRGRSSFDRWWACSKASYSAPWRHSSWRHYAPMSLCKAVSFPPAPIRSPYRWKATAILLLGRLHLANRCTGNNALGSFGSPKELHRWRLSDRTQSRLRLTFGACAERRPADVSQSDRVWRSAGTTLADTSGSSWPGLDCRQDRRSSIGQLNDRRATAAVQGHKINPSGGVPAQIRTARLWRAMARA
jgi:hypothetical protein